MRESEAFECVASQRKKLTSWLSLFNLFTAALQTRDLASNFYGNWIHKDRLHTITVKFYNDLYGPEHRVTHLLLTDWCRTLCERVCVCVCSVQCGTPSPPHAPFTCCGFVLTSLCNGEMTAQHTKINGRFFSSPSAASCYLRGKQSAYCSTWDTHSYGWSLWSLSSRRSGLVTHGAMGEWAKLQDSYT